jgi:hypothetical protein
MYSRIMLITIFVLLIPETCERFKIAIYYSLYAMMFILRYICLDNIDDLDFNDMIGI